MQPIEHALHLTELADRNIRADQILMAAVQLDQAAAELCLVAIQRHIPGAHAVNAIRGTPIKC
jgi:hypothetical protein